MDVPLVHFMREVGIELCRQELVVQLDGEVVLPDAVTGEERVLMLPVRMTVAATLFPKVTITDIGLGELLAADRAEPERMIDAGHGFAAVRQLENAPDDDGELVGNAEPRCRIEEPVAEDAPVVGKVRRFDRIRRRDDPAVLVVERVERMSGVTPESARVVVVQRARGHRGAARRAKRRMP